MVELASIVGFLVVLLVSTMIYVVTRLLGEREGLGRAFLKVLNIWQTTSPRNDPNSFGNITGYFLYYEKSYKFTWHKQHHSRG